MNLECVVLDELGASKSKPLRMRRVIKASDTELIIFWVFFKYIIKKIEAWIVCGTACMPNTIIGGLDFGMVCNNE